MSGRSASSRHVVVDMTPLGPRGQNGGAGLVATSLVRHLSALDDRLRLTLLTASDSDPELAVLDATNVQRRCVVTRPGSQKIVRRVITRMLPRAAAASLRRTYRQDTTSRAYQQTLDDLQPDLLFCPFTVPYFWRPGLPCVAIVYDLQHLTYPQFFTAEQRFNRQCQLQDALAASQRIACISDYVRQSLLSNTDACAERAVTIRLGLLHEPIQPDASCVRRLGLEPGKFLLYPANFWPHKNHRRLFEALQLYNQSHPESRLRLVCTGAPNPFMHALAREAPPDLVVFAGYVSEAELVALLDASAALIYPSLYEGFGMPVLEAMARGRAVLCSNVTSLPEVAGDAAIYFDPVDARQIAEAITNLEDRAMLAVLAERGRRRAAGLGTGLDMALRYLGLFDEAIADKAHA